jgi:hypothetical protein
LVDTVAVVVLTTITPTVVVAVVVVARHQLAHRPQFRRVALAANQEEVPHPAAEPMATATLPEGVLVVQDQLRLPRLLLTLVAAPTGVEVAVVDRRTTPALMLLCSKAVTVTTVVAVAVALQNLVWVAMVEHRCLVETDQLVLLMPTTLMMASHLQEDLAAQKAEILVRAAMVGYALHTFNF